MAACCSPLTTSTAARSTTSGPQRRGLRGGQSALRSWNARTAGSTEQGSAPACRSTEVIATSQLADSPRAGQIAEVDDPVRRPQTPARGGRPRCRRSRRRAPPATAAARPAGSTRFQAARAAAVTLSRRSSSRTCPGQRVHHPQRVPQVPNCSSPVQARVLEAAQRQADLPGHRTQARDDPRRQGASAPRERPAGQKAQHPGQGPAPIGWAPHRLGPHRLGRRPRTPRPVRASRSRPADPGTSPRYARPRRPGASISAALNAGFAIFSTPSTLPPSASRKFAVLLAAQRLRLHREAEQSRDPFGLKDRHLRKPAARRAGRKRPRPPQGTKTTRPTVASVGQPLQPRPAPGRSSPSRSLTSGRMAPSATILVSWAWQSLIS